MKIKPRRLLLFLVITTLVIGTGFSMLEGNLNSFKLHVNGVRVYPIDKIESMDGRTFISLYDAEKIFNLYINRGIYGGDTGYMANFPVQHEEFIHPTKPEKGNLNSGAVYSYYGIFNSDVLAEEFPDIEKFFKSDELTKKYPGISNDFSTFLDYRRLERRQPLRVVDIFDDPNLEYRSKKPLSPLPPQTPYEAAEFLWGSLDLQYIPEFNEGLVVNYDDSSDVWVIFTSFNETHPVTEEGLRNLISMNRFFTIDRSSGEIKVYY